MKKILLLGAGFSRNYGGWLAAEVVGELCARLEHRPHLLKALAKTSNFEEVYENLRIAAADRANVSAQEDMRDMDAAIHDTFMIMNRAFVGKPHGIDFHEHQYRWLERVMVRFDAIFTLNQDLLLELHYRSLCYPGVELPANWKDLSNDEKVKATFTVDDKPAPVPPDGQQPIYKLHGSANWQTSKGEKLMLIGTGSKVGAIEGNSLLASYHAKFRDHLRNGRTKLMTIGYGFNDQHINKQLTDASAHQGLRTYLVNPSGLGSCREKGAAGLDYDAMQFIGVSMRPLAETFAGQDDPSFNSYWKFITSD